MSASTPAVGTVEWFVNAIGEDAEFAQTSQAEAEALVNNFIGGQDNPFGVPTQVLERAILEVGADLYYRRAARNGIVGLDGVDPQPMRLNRDPMSAAYALLRPYLVTGI